jgi:succinate dehydrogenase/fumarate reductase cytochrome b subunit
MIIVAFFLMFPFLFLLLLGFYSILPDFFNFLDNKKETCLQIIFNIIMLASLIFFIIGISILC